MVRRLRAGLTPLLLLIVLGLLVAGLTPAPTPDQELGVRAQEGDTVLVWMNFVKPDQVEQYEEFVFEIFIPALEKLAVDDVGMDGQLRQTRLMRPILRGDEEVLSYVWLMDPIVSGTSYGFGPILRAVYGDEKAAEYSEMFRATEAQPQVVYRTTQTAW